MELSNSIDHIITKHQDLLKELETGMNYTIDISVSFEEQNDSSQSKQMEQCLQDYFAMETDIQNHITALNEIKAKCQMGQEDLTEYLGMRLQQLKSESSKVDYRRHKKLLEFKQKLMKNRNPNEPIPGDHDEELIFVSQEITLKCPLTLQTLETPVRNKICGHSYSKDAIYHFLRENKRTKKSQRGCRCPVAGCEASVAEETLERDVDTERALKRKNLNKDKIRSSQEDIIEL